jgi:hypothetical protein
LSNNYDCFLLVFEKIFLLWNISSLYKCSKNRLWASSSQSPSPSPPSHQPLVSMASSFSVSLYFLSILLPIFSFSSWRCYESWSRAFCVVVKLYWILFFKSLFVSLLFEQSGNEECMSCLAKRTIKWLLNFMV